MPNSNAPICTTSNESQRRQQRNRRNQPLGQPLPSNPFSRNPANGSSGISQRWRDIVHSFIRSMRSTASVARARKTAIMMASPTAASAAATIITKKTNIWPFTGCHWWAKVTNERLTAFSINSIDINTVIRLRLMRNPTMPRQNSRALRSRYQERGLPVDEMQWVPFSTFSPSPWRARATAPRMATGSAPM